MKKTEPKIDAATMAALQRAVAKMRPCEGPGVPPAKHCDRKAGVPGASAKLCVGHYKQKARGHELAPLAARAARKVA